MIKNLSILITTSLFTISAHAYAPWQRNYEPKQYIRLDTGFMIKNQIEENYEPENKPAGEEGAAAAENNEGPKDRYLTSNGTFGGIAVGYEFLDDYRGEVEVLYTPPTKTKIEKAAGGHTDLFSSHAALLFNIYYAPKNFELFKPYIFFGMGYSRNRTSNIKAYNSDNGLVNVQRRGGNTHYAWNIGGGLTFNITDKLLCDLGYRFINYGTLKSSARGTYGPAHPLSGKRHTDPTYTYSFGKVKSYQVSMSLRYFVD
ncbi:MAG: pagN 3 [Rickettsiaceae bacterium]|jgi:opacity protein-like surface antigen|nr:pagN 3 [Rickettsiaceae bacterium]